MRLFSAWWEEDTGLPVWALPLEPSRRSWALVNVWNLKTLAAPPKTPVTLGKWRQHKSYLVKTTGSGTRLFCVTVGKVFNCLMTQFPPRGTKTETKTNLSEAFFKFV